MTTELESMMLAVARRPPSHLDRPVGTLDDIVPLQLLVTPGLVRGSTIFAAQADHVALVGWPRVHEQMLELHGVKR